MGNPANNVPVSAHTKMQKRHMGDNQATMMGSSSMMQKMADKCMNIDPAKADPKGYVKKTT
jgi:hypothetical protein